MKVNYKIVLLLSGAIISIISCTNGIKSGENNPEIEVLPEDIVEMREDQNLLAGIQMGFVEMRSLNNSLKSTVRFPLLLRTRRQSACLWEDLSRAHRYYQVMLSAKGRLWP